MAKITFDDEFSRLVEEFNASPGAQYRRSRILEALRLEPDHRVLDVGCGPGHQALEIAEQLGATGRIDGVDVTDEALEIARTRCSESTSSFFHVGSATKLPFDDCTFDTVMSSQVFEYLDDVPAALAEVYRVAKPGGRAIIHDTDWGALLWHSTNVERMTRLMTAWDAHLVDPHMPQSLGKQLVRASFARVQVDPIVHVETDLEPGSMSDVLIRVIAIYLTGKGISKNEIEDWEAELRARAAAGEYFFSSNEYIFSGVKPE